MAIRPNDRLVFVSMLALVLFGAVTTPTGTSSATNNTGGKSTFGASLGASSGSSARTTSTGGGGATNGSATAVGNSTRRPASTGGIAATTAAPNWATAGRSTVATWHSGGVGGNTTSSSRAGNTVAGNPPSVPVAPPSGIDAGTTRPTWREAEVVLTVDPSYMALPYAKLALEAALLAWTSAADQLPKVTLRYAEDSLETQASEQNLADHRIFFAPYSDQRAKGALAITLVTADEGKNSILDADILVNGGHLFTDVTRGDQGIVQSSAYDLQDVITHELGHWFGLDEDYANADATMYAYVYPGETRKRDLGQSDITAVQLAYWQADNPSENGGCSLARTPTDQASWLVGCLAVAFCLQGRRNRRRRTQFRTRSRRLQY